MRVFISGTSFDTSYGGPAVSVASHAVELAKAGARVTVWAPDGSASRNPILAGQPGLEPISGRLRDVWTTASRTDLIHDNGIWMPHNHAIAVAARREGLPRLVSVRGIAVEAPLTGSLLIISNDDQPGVIGEVGSILGKQCLVLRHPGAAGAANFSGFMEFTEEDIGD